MAKDEKQFMLDFAIESDRRKMALAKIQAGDVRTDMLAYRNNASRPRFSAA
jgi:hypothetical protein